MTAKYTPQWEITSLFYYPIFCLKLSFFLCVFFVLAPWAGGNDFQIVCI